MGTLLRVLKNSAFLTVATLLDRAGEYILVLYITRTLGVLFFSEYHLIVSLLYVFQNLANFGLIQLVTREISKQKDRTGQLVLSYGLLGAGLSVVLMGAMVLSGRLLGYPPETMSAIYLVSLSILPGTLRGIGEGAVFAWERMELVTLIRFSFSLVRVSVSITLLILGYGLLPILGVLLASQWLAAFAAGALVHRALCPLNGPVRRHLTRRSLSNVAVFTAMSVFLVGANNIDAVLISKLAALEVVGLYGAASKLVQAIVLVRPSIMHSLFPTLARLSDEAPERFQMVAEQALKLLLVILLPAALVIYLLADILVPFLYKEQFAAAVAPLRILIWVIVPSFAYAVLTRTLVASGHEKPTLVTAALSMIANVGLDVVLIPRHGAVGAAWASVVSMGLAATINYWFVRQRLFRPDLMGVIVKPVLGILCLGVVAFLSRQLPWPLQVLVLVVAYVPALFLLRITRPSEWSALWRALRSLLGQKGAAV